MVPRQTMALAAPVLNPLSNLRKQFTRDKKQAEMAKLQASEGALPAGWPGTGQLGTRLLPE